MNTELKIMNTDLKIITDDMLTLEKEILVEQKYISKHGENKDKMLRDVSWMEYKTDAKYNLKKLDKMKTTRNKIKKEIKEKIYKKERHDKLINTIATRKQKEAFRIFYMTFDLDKFFTTNTLDKYIELFEKLSILLYENKITKEEIQNCKIDEINGYRSKNYDSLTKLIKNTNGLNL